MKVQIGTWEVDYTVVETNAPKAYDGFGTTTLYEDGVIRWVAVDKKHLTWQTMRYASGMHTHTEMPTSVYMVQDVLIKRVLGEEK